MNIKFYPYDFDYKIKEGEVYIYLFSKLEGDQEKQKKICVIQKYQPYFYAKIHDIDQEELQKKLQTLKIEDRNNEAKAIKWEEVEKELLGKKEKFWKIYVNYPQAVPLISKHLEACGVQCYEKDILFVHRYLRDLDLTPMTLINSEGDFDHQFDPDLRIPAFLAKSIQQDSKEELKVAKILAIDIETYNKEKIIDMEKNPILMIALYGVDEEEKPFKKVLTWKKFEHRLEFLEYVNNEIEMLTRLREIIISYQPDIITGYFSDGFDFPYIKARADKYKIKLDLGLDRSELNAGKKINSSEGKTKIKGILHLDMFKFIRHIFGKNLKTESYSLDAVSEELLNHKKHELNIADLADVWDNQPEQLTEFCEYNLHDSYLALMLCQKLLPDMIEFAKIIGLPLFDLTRMSFSRLVENYILKRAIEYNVLAPNKPNNHEIEQRNEETYQGGFVYEPTPGVYEDIIVFDFRSLYPTIITAHNIGPESLNCQCCQKKEEAYVPEQGYYFCTSEKKFIPGILEMIILRRISLKRLIEETKAKGKEIKILESRSYALKLLANSFYGYLGFFGARWYCLECVKSITAYARNYIQETIKKAQEKGFEVVYADSLTPERKIFVYNPNGDIKLVPIGKFVDENLKNKKIQDYKTLAFDGEKLVFSPITKVIRHFYDSREKGKIIKFITTHGVTRVTPQHSIYKYDQGRVNLTNAQTVTKSDYLISLTNVPKFERYKEGQIFDLADFGFGKMEDKIYFYKDNLRFPLKRGICPYCNKDVFLSKHVFNVHSNRKVAKKINLSSEYKWVGTKNAGGGRIPRYWKLTAELAWVLGYYCADGSVSDILTKERRRKCLLSFGSQDFNKIQRVKKYFDNLLNDNLRVIVSYDKRINKNMYYYRVQRIPLVGLIEAGFGCGKKSIGKKVPNFIYTAEEKIRKAFVDGYLAGDGRLKKDKKYRTNFIACDTNSKNLACGLQYLFKSLNHGKSYHKKEIKHVGWRFRPDKVNISSLRIQSVKRTDHEKENFCAARIKEIVKENYEGYVYDLEVKGQHNFVDAEGLILVHNTDSCFLLLGDKIKDQAMEFMNEINFDLPGHMELEFEGHFPRGIFVAVKGTDKGSEKVKISGTSKDQKSLVGAKKKYALISKEGKIKITGFETVRRNWSLIAKEVQEEVLKLVLNDKVEEALSFVKEIIKKLKQGQIELSKLIIKTQITKDLSAYSSIGPHVAVALRMLEQKIYVGPGTVVEYIIVKGSGLIRERAKLISEVKSGDYDANYYLNNQIIPAVASIFAVLGYDENDFSSDESQKGLGKWF